MIYQLPRRTRSMSEKFINEKDILNFILNIVKFPFAQVCKHYVAGNLLSLLEEKGMLEYEDADRLAKALVKADDENSIRILKKLLEQKND